MCIRLPVTFVAPVLCTLAATLLLSVSAEAHGQQTPPPADGILQEIGPDGLRFNRNAWSLDGAQAWQTWGGDAVSDARRRDPRAWLSGACRF